ncbi:acetolactate synthase small subunit [Trueperella sp. HMSC08B05]|mgnify:CR=1 FL=1|uniref:Acetolactate synthase small subunit n=1 Tax=Trueperella bernardiae TaxID=59561 RepID=A0A0W1KIV3_9ACTO|nr:MULTISPECIES: acetolactate synthase small subunit [Trueperella]KTF03436.1 Acetolactate synthase small subunit [Trueperella bernardiae]MDV6239489.1 acetolactate synthase small subunit [Trueperella bernardiae]OCW59880.1 acetolactate synthase [Trueperella bernardiae]OFS65245.1 acetolactate synthase small subunit [Trueperella sp. HMSC08H06]OFS73311.1 acetolactate synthase small subunit [Trueperella sp. HMSC08B05]
MISHRRTLSVLVENKPGVLARVSGLFARRAFNIHSLAVGPTEDPELSRITLVVDTSEVSFDQITKQLNKLINVIKISELERDLSVQRKLVLIKVRADDSSRTNVIQVVELFRAKIVDVVPDAVTIEATGSDDKINALLSALEPYGVKEIVQSGSVAISRGSRSMTEVVKAERKQLRGA